MPRSGVRARLDAVLAAASGSPAALAWRARPIAVGWATVDLDRAAGELTQALDLDASAFLPAPRSDVLCCTCRVSSGALEEVGSIALLEPDTEGRLAASLPRMGEGPAATWLRPDETDLVARDSSLLAAGLRLSTEREGPFGLERLILDETVGGTVRLLVRRPAGTIRP